jgi:hypothetical protein
LETSFLDFNIKDNRRADLVPRDLNIIKFRGEGTGILEV